MTHPNAGLHLTGICLVTINLTLIIMLSIVHCSYIVALTATVTTTDTDLQLGLNNYQSMGPMSERTPVRNSLRGPLCVEHYAVVNLTTDSHC